MDLIGQFFLVRFLKTLNIGLILRLIAEKVTKFLVEKVSSSEVMSQKAHGG